MKNSIIVLYFLCLSFTTFSAEVVWCCDKDETDKQYSLVFYKILSKIHQVDESLIKSNCLELSNEEIFSIDSLTCDTMALCVRNGDFTFLECKEPYLMHKRYMTYLIQNETFVFVNYSYDRVDSDRVSITFDGRPYFYEVIFNIQKGNIVYFR